MEGWKFGKGIQRREAQEERRQKQFEQEQTLNELERKATEIEVENLEAQQRRDEAVRQLKTAKRAKQAGNTELAAQEFQGAIGKVGLSPDDFAPDFARSADTLERSFKEPASVTKEQTIDAANRVFRTQLNKGTGKLDEPKRVNGKEVVEITDKEIAEVAPAPTTDGQGNPIEPGIMARLRVTGKTADGDAVQFRAPLTRDRSTREDDPATSVPIDDLSRQVLGRKVLMQGIAQEPDFRELVRLAKTRAGGETQSRLRTVTGQQLGFSDGLFQVDPSTSEITTVVEPSDGEGNTADTQRQRKVEALARREGVSREDAVDIVDGVRELTEPDQFGRQFIVDKLSGEREQVVARGSEANDGDRASTSDEGSQGAAPADTQPAERGVDIGGAVEEGTGPFAQVRSLVNSTIGPFVEGSPFADTEAAKENIKLFNFRLQEALSQDDGRLSNFEREIIQRFSPDPNRVFTDPDTERQKLIELKDFMRQQLKENQQSIESGEVTSDERGNLSNQNQTIERLLDIMGDVGPNRGQQQAGQHTRDNPARPQSQEDFDQLPSGAVFVNPATGELKEKQ